QPISTLFPYTTLFRSNVYDAYDDFTNGNNCVSDACNERVSVSYGVNPPSFTVDNQSGTATGSINPGHRLATDPRNGFIYSLFQRSEEHTSELQSLAYL